MNSTPPSPAAHRKRRLGEILLATGMLDEQQLATALTEQKKWGGKLGRTLVELGLVDEETMVLALSRQLNLPLINLDRQNLSPEVTHLLRVDLAEQYGVFPLGLQRGTTVLQLATSDPTNTEAFQDLSLHTNFRLQPVVAAASAIDRAIRRYYYGDSTEAEPRPPPVLTPPPTPTPTAPSASLPEPTMAEARTTPIATYSPTDPDLAVRVAQLAEQMDCLEQVVVGQVRALRGLLEVLLEKGVLTREEYLAKVRGRRAP